MTPSDEVRNYCFENYIIPAQERDETTVSIRAGDAHKALNYKDRMPLVCSALGSIKFEEMANVERISIEGSINGANAVYVFKILY